MRALGGRAPLLWELIVVKTGDLKLPNTINDTIILTRFYVAIYKLSFFTGLCEFITFTYKVVR